MAAVVRSMAAHIGEVTGSEPPTCPWRVFYDPLVRRVLDVCSLDDRHLAATALGPDPVAIELDAVGTYTRARNAAIAEEMERERKEREAQQRADQKAHQKRGRL